MILFLCVNWCLWTWAFSLQRLHMSACIYSRPQTWVHTCAGITITFICAQEHASIYTHVIVSLYALSNHALIFSLIHTGTHSELHIYTNAHIVTYIHKELPFYRQKIAGPIWLSPHPCFPLTNFDTSHTRHLALMWPRMHEVSIIRGWWYSLFITWEGLVQVDAQCLWLLERVTIEPWTCS